jgi:hypothetical protein
MQQNVFTRELSLYAWKNPHYGKTMQEPFIPESISTRRGYEKEHEIHQQRKAKQM